MLSKFFFNFWIWWYLVKSKDVVRSTVRTWLYFLGYFNLVPMTKNLFTPLYQDYSGIGRLTSFMIRSVWITIGSIFMVFVSFPLALYCVFIVVLPVLTIFMVIYSVL